MRRQVNARIRLNLERLDRPLVTLMARQLHSSVVAIEGIPSDVTSVIMRVFRTDGASHYDLPVSVSPDGAMCYIVGTCFPDVGDATYEVHGYDAEGNPTALGIGTIRVQPFSPSGSTPIEPGQPVPIMQIADRSGALHTIEAVWDGDNWTTIIDGE